MTDQLREYLNPNNSTFLGLPTERVGELVAMYRAAETNAALKQVLDQAFLIYRLSKTYDY